MKPFLKYVYALHILVFLGYNQQFTHACGSALNATSGSTNGSRWHLSQPATTPKFEAIIFIEELKENEENEQYASSREENTLVTFFDRLYDLIDRGVGNSASTEFLPHLNELKSLYLLFLVLRL